jgi:2-C-methyl-D-erythritol 4-phosphate cytidylyltransferase
MKSTKLTDAIRRVLPLGYCGAVIVAAGNASRMGGIDKILAKIGGEPVISRSVRAFQECDAVAEIVVVTRPDLIPEVSKLCGGNSKVTAVVAGGKDRVESVHLGLNALSEDVKLAAIHDGARPMATWQLIDRCIRAANTYGAAAPAIPVKDTIKNVEGGIVVNTPDRAKLRAVQTPQVFDIDLLKAALQKAKEDGAAITDDCSAVERLGMKVRMVEGDERNIKVTTPMDLKIATMLLEEMK